MYPFLNFRQDKNCLNSKNLNSEICKLDFNKQDFTMATIGEPYNFYLISLDEKNCINENNGINPILKGGCKVFNVKEAEKYNNYNSNLFEVYKKYDYLTSSNMDSVAQPEQLRFMKNP
jgi:hypothetical protein